MTIKELLDVARGTQITDEQIIELRKLMEEQGRKSDKTLSTEFLSRTYSI